VLGALRPCLRAHVVGRRGADPRCRLTPAVAGPAGQAAAPERAAAHLLAQAQACDRLGSPLYGRLLRGLADDLRAGGPVADALADHLG
ncbi:hypothetical protein RMT89_43740, partial [Streptomyces sp. P17]|nr:hypothetical protein [Streptomyces sp. P17]